MKRQLQRLLSLAVAVLFAASGYAYDVYVDGIYYDLDETERTASVTYNSLSETDRYAGSVSIPASITSGGVTYSVTSIGYDAFFNCGNLTSVIIPGSVTSIGDFAFSSCSRLTSVTIPSSVTSIGNGAFFYCWSLTSVTIPGSVTSIGDNAFFNCTRLTSINVEADNPAYSSVDGVVYSKDKTSIVLFPAGKGGAFAIPNSVTSIGGYAFSGCTGLTSVTIPGSVTNIGEGAFRYCTGLTSVTIPGSVTSIGNIAFSGCKGLTSINVEADNPAYSSVDGVVYSKDKTSIFLCPAGKEGIFTIPESVTVIGDYAFYLCEGLTSVTIPNSVTRIGLQAFSCCTSLTSITIPASVTSIESNAFWLSESLTSINVDADNPAYSSVDGVLYSKDKTSILLFPAGKEDDAFTITIPNSVTSIGNRAFYDCTGLTSVTIPESVTSIGEEAFFYSGLTHIYVATATPPHVVAEAFDSATKQTATLYVPTGCLSVYGEAYEWGEFLHMEEWDPTGIGGVEAEAAAPVVVGWYDLNGRRLAAPAKGVHIVRYSDGTTRKVVVR